MKKESLLKICFLQIRGPFLILSAALVFLGTAAAYHSGARHLGHALLALLGVVLTHISVNLFNELSDFHTKIDAHTIRTPFSGGSGLLQSGITTAAGVRMAAYCTLGFSTLIGLYFCMASGWTLLIFMLLGGTAIRFYTTHLARWLTGEIVAGMTLGSFVVLGVYYILTSRLPVSIVWISIPPGILTALLLFLNEFPDMEADKQGGRRHLVIQLGRKKSAAVYVWSMIVTFAWILAAPFFFDIPYTVLLGLAPVPLAFVASQKVLSHYDTIEKLIPALGMNVGVVILTDFFLGAGYFL
jgi:1,4-dihydroxy-2-naphthoate octaprenyltransferase